MDDMTAEERCLGRIVDRCDTPADWDRLTQAADRDPDAYARLVDALRDDCDVRTAVGGELDGVDAIELPDAATIAAASDRGLRSSPLGWLGWAAALLVALLWWGTQPEGDELLPELLPRSGVVVDVATPQPAELPLLLHRAEPTEDGTGVRVTYVRRILEHAVVDQAFAVRPAAEGPVPVHPALYETPTDF